MRPASGLTRAIWMLLVKEGGYWSAPEVLAALPDEVFATKVNVNNALRDMCDSGSVQRKGDGRGTRYGVTGNCRVPMGLLVHELECIRPRAPEASETGLSTAEVEHGHYHGLLAEVAR